MKLSIAPAVKEKPTFFCSSLFDNYPTDRPLQIAFHAASMKYGDKLVDFFASLGPSIPSIGFFSSARSYERY